MTAADHPGGYAAASCSTRAFPIAGSLSMDPDAAPCCALGAKVAGEPADALIVSSPCIGRGRGGGSWEASAGIVTKSGDELESTGMEWFTPRRAANSRSITASPRCFCRGVPHEKKPIGDGLGYYLCPRDVKTGFPSVPESTDRKRPIKPVRRPALWPFPCPPAPAISSSWIPHTGTLLSRPCIRTPASYWRAAE